MQNMTITPTEEQQAALDSILAWANHHGDEYSLGGFAGTGKTTIVKFLVDALDKLGGVTVCAPTGKAAHELKNKGMPGACTVHHLIYDFQGEYADPHTGELKPIFNPADDSRSNELFVVCDEASMVNTKMAEDMRTHNHRILWVGDHGQLPPIGGDPGIMAHPNARLETIHRQAENSPILRFAHKVRQGEEPRPYIGATFPELEIKKAPGYSGIVTQALDDDLDILICAYNNTRHTINTIFRDRLGMSDTIDGGDKVMCLRNNHDKQIFNGMLFTVVGFEYHPLDARVALLDLIDDRGNERNQVPVQLSQFGRQRHEDHEDEAQELKSIIGEIPSQFDYGYCVTAHKAQGSEFDRVGLVYQSCQHWEMSRWGYTSITRAKNYLKIWA